MKNTLQHTDDGVVFEDGVLTLRDGRELAWRWWGDNDGTPLLRIQGTPSSRLQRSFREKVVENARTFTLRGEWLDDDPPTMRPEGIL